MQKQDTTTEINRLTEIMATLRSNKGCPWDRKQTPASLKSYILEEACELLEAIDDGDPCQICDELGDLLLQTIFIAQIFSEQQVFNFADVARGINEKMIRRHPHVFADTSSEGHAQRWEEIKRSERKLRGADTSLEKTISRQLPALKRASKAISKTQHLEKIDPSKKLSQQCADLTALSATDTSDSNKKGLLANMLFTMAQLCVAYGQDAEELLRGKTTEYLRETDRNMAITADKK
jgi:MazG family protein